MYFSNTDKEVLANYLSRIGVKSFLIFGRNKKVLEAILAYLSTDEYNAYSNDKEDALYKMLWTEETTQLTSIFSGGEYQVLVTLLGKEWAGKFKKVWDRSSNYIYTSGFDRRSFRSKANQVLYLSSAIANLRAMVALVATGFTYEQYFADKDNRFAYNCVIPELLALEIDEGNTQILNRIQEIIYGDNNTGLMTREIIKGILMSHSTMAHKWLGDLLLAAQLQEGLRQVIAECMDEGSREGFLFMARLILEHDLIRFSSVVRALDTWTGLGISAEKPQVVKKCLEIACNCLTEPGYIDECLKSTDTLHIYMGLWVLAFDEVTSIEPALKRLLTTNEKYKKLVALYFLRQIHSPCLQTMLALPYLKDPDYEVKAWALVNIFSDVRLYTFKSPFPDNLTQYQNSEGMYNLQDQFDLLKSVLDNMPQKEMVFSESVFPWLKITFTSDEIITKMLLTVMGAIPNHIVDMMLDYRDKMSAETREFFLDIALKKPQTQKQKTALLELMSDRSSSVRYMVMKIMEKLSLSEEDYLIIEDLLRYKSGDLRKNASSLLLRRSPENLLGSVRRLLDSKNEQKIQAALDLISTIEKDSKFMAIAEQCRLLALTFSKTCVEEKTSQKTKELAEKITNADSLKFTFANGFGLYDPKAEITLPKIAYPQGFTSKQILTSSLEEIEAMLYSFSNLIEKYKDFEYEIENWNGSTERIILGAEWQLRTLKAYIKGVPTLDDYPLAEVWREAAKEMKLSLKKLLELLFYYCNIGYTYSTARQEWFEKLMSELFPVKIEKVSERIKKVPYYLHIWSILQGLFTEYPRAEIFQLCYDMSCFIYCQTPLERFNEDYEKPRDYTNLPVPPDRNPSLIDLQIFSYWYSTMRENVYDDESFRKSFQVGYAFYKASAYKTHASLQLVDFERAFNLSLVDENELLTELCGRRLSPRNLQSLTEKVHWNPHDFSAFPKLNEACKKVTDRVLEIELRRGDLPTEVSHLASRIFKCTGTRFFVDILVGAEKDSYVRGYIFVGGDSTKKHSFSHLLKCCFPNEGEDEITLRELLKNRKVNEKQLIDAAMYAPQWVEIVEKYLDWPGLKSAAWYFHAHVNDTFSPEKESIVARFSPLSPEDFKTVAFDINWFTEAYTALGEKRFKVVYDSAKYIAGGGLHKRSQLFADAVLGKITVEEAENVISTKRNKDYVLCYGLLPLGSNKDDLLHRYEYLHNFLTESKKFGTQRRDSEGKVTAIALENLARNAGFADIIRFTWYMETEKMQAIKQYLKPTTVGEVEIQINIDELGKAAMAVTKAGKAQKDIPAKLKDNEYVKELKAVLKSLKGQHTRARISLERAMELGDEFTPDELQNLSANPVIAPLLENLVFKCGNRLGYFRDNALIGLHSSGYVLRTEERCVIAHPVHLYESGQWAVYQQDIYDRKIIQPFKQVFRELYRPNSDELALRTKSQRYAGHQIQPKKAAALLKGRGWTASYYEGLQKVYYRENIVAHIYALADWFSPAEVEAPTLEGVGFLERKTGKPLAFADIPPVIFSEIMRDIDLVVSVAFVGGVDPEASLSTIEMRSMIISEMLRLLKLTNVQLKGSHALIKGTLGEYTVHLGSGNVQQMAKGALNILPVHAQHRGRIFLPFIDDDPRTAEIISKIVLLAEDQKIKDPTVLVQIVN